MVEDAKIYRSRLQYQTLVLLGLCCCGRFQGCHDCLLSQIKIRMHAKSSLAPPDWKSRLTSSNTSLSLYCVRALHSTYFTAPSSLAILSPSSFRTGCIFCLASLSLTPGSSLRSTCVPTIRQGTPGQWWWTSGNHFSRTFSKEAGEVTLKQTRKTSV